MATAPLDELKTLLHHDISALQSLDALLQEERQALGANDITAVESMAEQKNELLTQLRDRAKEKIRHLVALGYRPADGLPSDFLQRLEDDELSSLWHQAYQAMADCQALNGVNGQVINHLQKRTARLSEIIRGVNPAHKLYGAQGREEAVSHKQVLANA